MQKILGNSCLMRHHSSEYSAGGELYTKEKPVKSKEENMNNLHSTDITFTFHLLLIQGQQQANLKHFILHI